MNKLLVRNYLVSIVMRKSGSGKHKNSKYDTRKYGKDTEQNVRTVPCYTRSRTTSHSV